MLDDIASAIIISILACKNALGLKKKKVFAFQLQFLTWEVASNLCFPFLMEVSGAIKAANRRLQSTFMCLMYLLFLMTASVLKCQYMNTSGGQIAFNLNFSSNMCLRE